MASFPLFVSLNVRLMALELWFCNQNLLISSNWDCYLLETQICCSLRVWLRRWVRYSAVECTFLHLCYAGPYAISFALGVSTIFESRCRVIDSQSKSTSLMMKFSQPVSSTYWMRHCSSHVEWWICSTGCHQRKMYFSSWSCFHQCQHRRFCCRLFTFQVRLPISSHEWVKQGY